MGQEISAEEPVQPTTQETPSAGQTVEQLQAKLDVWEAKYNKEVGDRDRGNARLAKEIKGLREELDLTRKGTEALALRTFGEAEPEDESEIQKWKKTYHKPLSSTEQQPAYTVEHYVASGRMIELAENNGIDFNNPPADMQPLINEVSELYPDNPKEAALKFKKGLNKRVADMKAKTDAEEKEKQEATNRKAKQGQRDTSTSTGGGSSDWASIRDRWITNPGDPVAFQAYMEARKARGI